MVGHRSPFDGQSRSNGSPVGGLTLPLTADQTAGMSNLATVPRAGNISTDTRAG
jgi:hypothetical protein